MFFFLFSICSSSFSSILNDHFCLFYFNSFSHIDFLCLFHVYSCANFLTSFKMSSCYFTLFEHFIHIKVTQMFLFFFLFALFLLFLTCLLLLLIIMFFSIICIISFLWFTFLIKRLPFTNKQEIILHLHKFSYIYQKNYLSLPLT